MVSGWRRHTWGRGPARHFTEAKQVDRSGTGSPGDGGAGDVGSGEAARASYQCVVRGGAGVPTCHVRGDLRQQAEQGLQAPHDLARPSQPPDTVIH
ncbi:hypothetical protein E2C01_029896 [Portunus trituberculatus]|uniref:Uncharacterized protein n=1 Tax=Portunus trituberculatus TaxID=210409 RepID=A0A5B7ET87_PORTR|nr:hypothetical protein [Portunus trituberculatus]